MTKVLGIFREVLHSPEREFDDLEILRLTGKRLAGQGLEVVLRKPEEILGQKDIGEPSLLFMMCEQEKVLTVIKSWEKNGVNAVNSAEAVLNTYRYRMVPMLKSAGISIPQSRLLSTSSAPDFAGGKVWVKRGDVHNTQKGDVFLSESKQEIEESFVKFHSRGIGQAVLQDPIEGDLIKFYGVGGRDEKNFWSRWFYHKGQDLKKHPFSEKALKDLTRSAAGVLGLEIFGGDAIVTAKGEMFLIDINAWPSFALFREEASKVISEHLLSKIKSLVR